MGAMGDRRGSSSSIESRGEVSSAVSAVMAPSYHRKREYGTKS